LPLIDKVELSPATRVAQPPPAAAASTRPVQTSAPVGGNAARGATAGTVIAGTAVAAKTVAQRPAAQGGGFDFWLLLPILVVGASVAAVAWFVWPKKAVQ
jgi:hypothetical protein